MADLSDRGQILLVAGFALAVTFLALAIVVNGAIFTENLASQGEDTGATGVIQLRHQVEQSVGRVMAAANEGSSSPVTDIEAGIRHLGTQYSDYAVLGGTNVSLSPAAVAADGDYVEDVVPGGTDDFTNASGDADWSVAESVAGTRNLRVEVTSAAEDVGDDDVFAVSLNSTGSDASWNLSVGTAGGDPAVRVRTSTGVDRTCRLSGASYPADLDVTAATFGGQHCAALAGAPLGSSIAAGSSYDVAFANADEIEGNYSVVFRTPTLDPADFGTRGTSAPFTKTAVYALEVALEVHSPDLQYGDDDLRVAPGESDA